MIEEPSRRAILVSAAAGIAGLVGLAPRAHAEATLDADVTVTDWRATDDGVGDLWLELDSRATEPIDPACICWGAKRQAQQPWKVVDGPRPLAPGASATYHITTPIPSPDVHLVPGKRAILFVYDSGRDARASDVFVPETEAVA